MTIGGVSVTDLAMAEDGSALKFTLPYEAPDGDILILCKSGIEVPVATLTSVKPSDCKVSPNPVKAGQVLQIDGKDMDLVVDVVFADAKGEYVLNNNQNIINTKEAYAMRVPELAVEGNLRLAMANGMYVEVPFTLVKPTVTGYDKSSVSAGGTLTINGTDLDLVKTVQFGDGSDIVTVEDATETSITLTDYQQFIFRISHPVHCISSSRINIAREPSVLLHHFFSCKNVLLSFTDQHRVDALYIG